jgi:steroid delta-isomerase-like uncharacterized protein
MAEWWKDYLGAWNTRDGSRVAAFMADGAVYEDLALHEKHVGADDIRGFVDRMAVEFSDDYRFEHLTFQQSGDDYAAEWRLSGTHNGAAGMLPATGRQFDIQGVSIGRLEGGRIKENRDYWDMVTFLTQVGLMAAPEGAASS